VRAPKFGGSLGFAGYFGIILCEIICFTNMVKIRLRRFGKRNTPVYRVVVADGRSPRDGRIIEEVGTYDPLLKNNNFTLKLDRVDYWLGVGAQASSTVASFIKKARKAGDEPQAEEVPEETVAETAVEAPVEAGSALAPEEVVAVEPTAEESPAPEVEAAPEVSVAENSTEAEASAADEGDKHEEVVAVEPTSEESPAPEAEADPEVSVAENSTEAEAPAADEGDKDDQSKSDD
jgi:small subunit ribosomal protein S16